MKNGKKRGKTGWIIAVLAAALIAVIVLILWKQWEYGKSTAFYDGLRGALNGGGLRL